MGTEIDAVIEQLERASDATEACGKADAWAEAGRTSDLVALATALVSGRGGEGRQALLDHVAERLATKGQPGIDALVTLARTKPEAARTRSFASRLGFATGSAPEELAKALARHASRLSGGDEANELFACWLHELVLRGAAVAELPDVRTFHASLADGGHVLGGLPLRLLGCEREAPTYLPMFGEEGIEEAVSSLERGSMSMRTLPPPAEHETPVIRPEADAALEARLAAAVKPWKKVEARLFRLAPALASNDAGKWLLRALPLACLESATKLTADRTGADAAFGTLFAAAANGGARDPGLGGAYGRSVAFRSFGALVGASEDASPADVDARARGCGFVMFRGAGGWFFDVAWDVGVLVLRDDGASCAVVAATDAD